VSRDRIIVLVLVALGLGLAGLAVWGDLSPGGAAVVVDTHKEGGSLSIVWGGDTLVGDASQTFAQSNGYGTVFRYVSPLLTGDVNIVNAEGPLTTLTTPFISSRPYSYTSNPLTASAMKAAGLTALGLANNHVMDEGPQGLTDTVDYAAKAGLATFGAGMNDKEAERPLVVKAEGFSVGVVALGKAYGTRVTAGRARAGTVVLSTTTIQRGYKLARDAGASYVVALVHWGENYLPVDAEQQSLAREFARAGYDLVIGTGPHFSQPAEIIGKTMVFYSIGNFVFGTPGRFTGTAPGYGLVLKTTFADKKLASIELACITTDNAQVKFQPRPADPAAAAKVFAGLSLPLTVSGATATFLPATLVQP
jgi:poly-gamma-glutamate capsule biosynthesis protein CapA/YwtB (metallophosphatase superfamily)